MRVLHVIPTISLAYGGPSVAVRAMTRALAARGHDVTVATTGSAEEAGAGADQAGMSVRHPGVTYRCFPQAGKGKWMFSWPLTTWLAREIAGFDVVHVHGLFQYPTIPACRFARRHRIPYILRPLGMLDAWSLAQRAWKKRPYLALIERSHIRNAAALHATSEAEAGHLRAMPARRIAVIPLGVETAESRPGPKLNHEGPLQVLFLSRVHPKKGVPVLLQALRMVRDAGTPVRATIAGGGEPAYLNELRSLASRIGIAELVSWTGQVDGEAKASLWNSADVFVLPSSQENFGIAVAEALAAGVPVLASHEVAIAGEVERAGAGRSLPIDAASFAEALIDYARRPDARLAAGRAAAALARSAYSWPASAERVEALYREVTGVG